LPLCTNIYATGTFSGPIDFGGEMKTPVGHVDVFVPALDSGGQHVWSEAFRTTGEEL
jgi:hypothetical protein